MNRTILIEFGNELVTAELLEHDAPNLCRSILDALPVETWAHHSRVSTHEIIIPFPKIIESENLTKEYGVGALAWVAARNDIDVFYDNIRPLGPLGLFGRIVHNLEGLKREAIKTWIKAGTKVRISKKQEND